MTQRCAACTGWGFTSEATQARSSAAAARRAFRVRVFMFGPPEVRLALSLAPDGASELRQRSDERVEVLAERAGLVRAISPVGPRGGDEVSPARGESGVVDQEVL